MRGIYKRIISFTLCLLMILQIDFTPFLTVEAASYSKEFVYTGGAQKFTAPYAGKYKFELYGGSGGGASKADGGLGGYTTGTINLDKGDVLWLQVGGQGTINGGKTYNGGGSASGGAGSGGGATSITKSNTSLVEAISTESVLLVAGGGGGKSVIDASSVGLQYRGTPKIGSGGGDRGTGVHTWAPSDIFGHQESETSNTFGVGQDSRNGSGAGGGGYYGGESGEHNYSGGAGGNGYYNTTDTYDSSTKLGVNLGEGKIKVTYLGTYDVTVTVLLGNNGYISGFNGNKTCAALEIKKPCGSSFNLPNAIPNDPSIVQFEGYSITTGNAIMTGNTVYVGMEGSTIKANFKSNGISFSGSVSGNKANLQWNDIGAAFYILYSGVDVASADVEEDYDVENATEFYNVSSSTVVMKNGDTNYYSSYQVPVSGIYALDIRGGKGGNSGGSGGWGSHSANANGANGSKTTAEMYLKKGDNLTFNTYAGGAGHNLGRAWGGKGGTGLGLLDNGTVILAAGGGGGANSAYLELDASDDHCHYNATSGNPNPSYTSSSTTGSNGYQAKGGGTYCNGRYIYSGTGGSGGGYPLGGRSANEGSSAGQSYVASSVNGQAVTASNISYGASNSLYLALRLIKIGGGTVKTSGAYNLYDKKAPFTPEPTANGGYEILGSDTDYTVSWKPVKDRGSENIFQVNSFDSVGVLLNKSAKISEVYTSGLKQYRYVVDSNALTKVNASHSATKNTSIKVSPSSYTQYIHIAAEDNAGNISETLTIEISGTKVLVYDFNNFVATNRYGDTFTTFAKGQMDSVMLQIGDSTKVVGNTGEYTREGYAQLLTAKDGDSIYTWNTSPDGSGKTYYAGQIISYDDISSAVLTLYAIWEPITYNVKFHSNDDIGDWNEVDDYLQVTNNTSNIRFDQIFTLDDIRFTRTAPKTLSDGREIKNNYSFTGWHTSKETNEVLYSAVQSVRNLRNTEGVYDLNAIWRRDLKLTFNVKANGGYYSNYNSDIVLSGSVYNSQYDYTFNLQGGKTPASLPKYNIQNGTLDIYGSVLSDETNTLYTKYDTYGVPYVFWGWSYDKDSRYPNEEFDFSNPARKTNLNIFNDTTLYAIWEPTTFYVEYDGNKATDGEVEGQVCYKDDIYYTRYNEFIREYYITLESQGGEIQDISENPMVESWSFINWSFEKKNEWEINSRTFEENEAFSNLAKKHKSTVVLKAEWEEGTITLPDVKKYGYKFIGWFDKPQDEHGDTDNGATYIGLNGDEVTLGKDMTIYAWWNKAPTYHDIYEGTFYEGQKVKYSDLLKLIGVADFEDDYRNHVSNKLNEIPTIEEITEVTPDDDTDVDFEAGNDKVEIQYVDESGNLVDKTSGLTAEEKEELNASVDPSNLVVKVKELTYHQSDEEGITFSHSGVSEYTLDGDTVKDQGLDTKTDNIGYFTVVYTVTDNGILNSESRIPISTITMEYSRKCQILYNNIPRIKLEKTIFTFTDDSQLKVDTVDDYFSNFVKVIDTQDCIDNLPWWSTVDTDGKKFPIGSETDETIDRLYDLVRVVDITDITISSGYLKDNPNCKEGLEEIKSLGELYTLKTTKPDLFNSITGYKIIFNTYDQWGKGADNSVTSEASSKGVRPTAYGEVESDDILQKPTVEDRTMQVININNLIDYDLQDSNLYRAFRYIGSKYLSTLGNTYWNDYGKSYLEKSLGKQKFDDAPNYQGKTQSGVSITVNDYSDN